MNQPAVSVVISTVNRRATLELALESLLQQRVPDGLEYEIIVVDNNSPDDTHEAVERLIRLGCHRLRYAFEPRPGVSYGRNAGIRLARAPIIAFTDDDNEAEPDWVAGIVRSFVGHPDAGAVGGPIAPIWLGPVPHWLDERHWSPLAILNYGDAPIYTSQENPRCLLTANFAVRRAIFERIGGFSPAFPRCQDHEWLIRFWRAGHKALYDPTLKVRARVTPERMTRRYHRQWHLHHGQFAATMRLQEIVGPTGRLLDAPVPSGAPFGMPGYVYRELALEVLKAVRHRLAGRRHAAFEHGNRVRYLAAYVRRRLWQSRRAAPAVEWPLAPAADARPSTDTTSAAAAPMSAGRLVTIHGLGGSAWDLVRDQGTGRSPRTRCSPAWTEGAH